MDKNCRCCTDMADEGCEKEAEDGIERSVWLGFFSFGGFKVGFDNCIIFRFSCHSAVIGTSENKNERTPNFVGRWKAEDFIRGSQQKKIAPFSVTQPPGEESKMKSFLFALEA